MFGHDRQYTRNRAGFLSGRVDQFIQIHAVDGCVYRRFDSRELRLILKQTQQSEDFSGDFHFASFNDTEPANRRALSHDGRTTLKRAAAFLQFCCLVLSADVSQDDSQHQSKTRAGSESNGVRDCEN